MAPVSSRKPLSAEELRWRCDADCLPFATTAELEPLDRTIGQERAVEALELALAMDHQGYNVYALGPEGVGKHRTVTRLLRARAATRPGSDDWVYVGNFTEPRQPRLLRLPRGTGRRLRDEMDRFVQDLGNALKNAFDNDEYRTNVQVIEAELKDHQDEAVEEIQKQARDKQITVIRSQMGFAFAPMQEGKVLPPEAFNQLPEAERERIAAEVEALQEALQARLSRMPEWVRETRNRIREVNERTAALAVDYLIELIKRNYAGLEEVLAYLDRLRDDVVQHARAILEIGNAEDETLAVDGHPLLRRYRINLLVDNTENDHAPVVFEDDPTFERLIGRIDHRVDSGALVTDFLMVHGGALQRANGGYLVLDARKLLSKPLAYEALKRALQARSLRIEPLAQALGMMGGETLEPEPMPLDVKVVLIGERSIYYLLAEADPELTRLFKIVADFDDRIRRDAESQLAMARMMAGLVEEQKLQPIAKDGVIAGLRFLARLAGHGERLDTNVEALADLLREADHLRAKDGASVTVARHVVGAAAQARRRHDRLRELGQEMIQEGTIAIATSGAAIGQINGLSVMQMGGMAFGRPSRISARVRVGAGHLVDIEREVKLGGPLHSKGVLILAGYLSAHYSPRLPLSLSASLVFEQSYGGVDGDSASVAELLALTSAIARIPLDQGLAVTGSIDQWGTVQAIGGINEKIEGHFDICAERGLTGTQGVVMPATNLRHLVLEERVLKAVEQGRFAIHAVSHVDQAIEIFTGMPAGSLDARGTFEPQSYNAAVQRCLRDFAETRRRFAKAEDEQRQAPDDDHDP